LEVIVYAHMRHLFTLFVAVVFGVLAATTSPAGAADEPADKAFFEQRIRPLLAEHCYACHSERAEKLRGGLLLDSKAGWQRGGDGGAAVIVPGKPAESLLLQYVRHEDGMAMPPDRKLPAAAIADLTTWIAAGAVDPRDGATLEARRADKTWWSLQPVRSVAPPQPADLPEAWSTNPIDRFIFAAMREKQLSPSPPAGARDLLRRLSYDVVGLPPTADEVEAFAKAYAADADRAVAATVDRLLASPHYGERWGRHWLDVVRFGESNGFERNVAIDDLWPFRDYVIQSLNDDKPLDRFIVEHLAGDVVGPDDPNVSVGSAFLVCGPYDDVGNQDAVAKLNIRAATLDDMITATGGAFLGLTVNCARCHHHKFDPLPTEDYYRMRAAFEGVEHGRREIATQAERDAFAAAVKPLDERRSALAAEQTKLERAIEARARDALRQRTFARPKIDPQRTDERFAPTPARYVRFVMQAHTGDAKSAVGSRLVEFEVWTAEPQSRNVALAATGATAAGEKSTTAEDFPEAYGPQFAIDGRLSEQWFVGKPAVLTVTLAQTDNRPDCVLELARRRHSAEESARRNAVRVRSADVARRSHVDDRRPWARSRAVVAGPCHPAGSPRRRHRRRRVEARRIGRATGRGRATSSAGAELATGVRRQVLATRRADVRPQGRRSDEARRIGAAVGPERARRRP